MTLHNAKEEFKFGILQRLTFVAIIIPLDQFIFVTIQSSVQSKVKISSFTFTARSTVG